MPEVTQTPTYGFPYPTGTDSLSNVALRIQKLAERMEETYGLMGIDTSFSNLMQTGDAAGGSLTGFYPNPTIATNVINNTMIQDNAINTAQVADGAITTSKIATSVNLNGSPTTTTQATTDNSTNIATTAFVQGVATNFTLGIIPDGSLTNIKIADGAGILYSKLDLSTYAGHTVCTSSTNPASPFNGQMIWETDTKFLKMYNGTAWVVIWHTDVWSFNNVGNVLQGASAITNVPRISLTNTTADASSGNIIMQKSRTSGIVSSQDVLGAINFNSHDGTGYQNGAQIQAIAVGASSAGSTPTGLVFSTVISGTTALVERMRINSGGQIYFGNGATNATPLNADIRGTGGSGTDVGGADLNIRGGQGTGAAAGGYITFYTSPAGSTGTSANTYNTNLILTPTVTYFGNSSAASPKLTDIRGESGSGTDIAGAEFRIAPGRGTGAGAGGSFTVFTAPSSTTSAVLNASVERFRISSGGVAYFGNGSTNAAPNVGQISATSGAGTNISGADIYMDAGRGTGTGTGGSIILRSSAAGSAGSTINAIIERMRINTDGFITISNGSFGRGAPVTKTANFTLATNENNIICNNASNAVLTVTFPAASSWTGREVMIKNINTGNAASVVSASSNVVPLSGTTAGTSILPAGQPDAFATLVSDGTNWVITQSNAFNVGHLVVANAAARPAAPIIGQMIYQVDSDELLKYVTDLDGTTRWMIADHDFRRNMIINGAFDVWQRGFSFNPVSATTTTGLNYGADRWQFLQATTSTAAFTRQAITSTDPAGYNYYTRVQRANTLTLVTPYTIQTSFESQNIQAIRGRFVTLSFWARAGANYSNAASYLVSNIVTGTGTDNTTGNFTTNTVNTTTNNVLTTSWKRFTITTSAALATTITQLGVSFVFTPVGTAGAADYFDITGVQLEVGSAPSDFEFRDAGEELRRCQRYYYRITNSYMGFGIAASTTVSDANIQMPVTLRVAPSSIEQAAITDMRLTDGVTGFTCNTTALSLQSGGTANSLVRATATGLTQYRPYYLDKATANGYIGFPAEL